MPPLPETVIAARYTQLEPRQRGPKTFWAIAVDELPVLRTRIKPLTHSWADIRVFLAGPQFYELERLTDGDNPEAGDFRDAAKVASLALALIGKHDCSKANSGSIERTTIQFCAYCWRIGRAPKRSTGIRQAKRMERSLAKHIEANLNSPVRCALHRTEKSRTGARRNIAAVRLGRAREKALEKRERTLIEADRKKHQAPGLRFQIKGEIIIESSDRSRWADFIRKTFSFAAYEKTFEGLCDAPERAFSILDAGNSFPNRDEIHAEILSDKAKLAFYLMPMILRADVWVEFDERARLMKAHEAKLKRWEDSGCQGRKPRFKMPSRAEWARYKELEVHPKWGALSPGRKRSKSLT